MAGIKRFTLRGAKLIYKEFGGKGKYSKGKPSVCVILDDKLAKEMTSAGYNVKFPEPYVKPETGEVYERNPYLKLKIATGAHFPTIIMISNDEKHIINEANAGILDYQYIPTADLEISGSKIDYNGQQFTVAYLNKAYLTIAQDELDLMYADIPFADARDAVENSIDD